jgi:hypothetical protein
MPKETYLVRAQKSPPSAMIIKSKIASTPQRLRAQETEKKAGIEIQSAIINQAPTWHATLVGCSVLQSPSS